MRGRRALVRRRRYAWLFVILLVAPGGDASADDEHSLQEIRECLRARKPTSLKQTLMIRTTDRYDNARTRRAEVLWRQDSDDESSDTMVRLESPPSLRRTAFLVIAEEGRRDMFTYLPEYDRVRRILPEAAVGSLFGTDFSYEDIEYVQQLGGDVSFAGRRRPNRTLRGRDVHVVEHRPKANESTYSRVVTFVEERRCVVLEVRFFGPKGDLHKVLRAFDLQEQDGHWFARRVEMENGRKGSRTELRVSNVTINPELGEKYFSVRNLLQHR